MTSPLAHAAAKVGGSNPLSGHFDIFVEMATDQPVLVPPVPALAAEDPNYLKFYHLAPRAPSPAARSAARSPSQPVSENCGVGKYFFYPIVETLHRS